MTASETLDAGSGKMLYLFKVFSKGLTMPVECHDGWTLVV